MKIAISGKGGVGKTTISAGLVKFFSNQGHRVYAVDADPDVSLGATLGLPAAEVEKLTPLVDMKEVIESKSRGGGAFFDLNPKVDDVIEDYSLKAGNLRFLRMGGVKGGGTACYCKENSFLHSVLNTLLFDQDDVVILDMSAGIEHLTRGTSQGVDLMLVVTEPTRVSIQTAKVVQKLARQMGVSRVKVLGNKIRSRKEEDFFRSQFPPGDIIGVVPFNEKVLEMAMDESTGILQEEPIQGMAEVYQKIVEEVKGKEG
jgi:CO dehydrogenase maturation factor